MPEGTQRIALGVSYNGQRYNGWQSQPSGHTVQDHLEAALGRFAALAAPAGGRGVVGINQLSWFSSF